MSAVIGILLFFLGLAVGSFISCLVFRVNQENRLKGLLKGRSYCPKCKKQLFWYDNIPLISFIFLKGRCRWCHSPIGVHYPLVELATGLATLFVFFHLAGVEVVASPPPRWPNGLLGGVFFSLLITYALIAIFLTDLRYRTIPDQIIYPAIALVIIFHLFHLAGVEVVT